MLEARVQARWAVFERYFEALSRVDGIKFMPEASYGRATRWLTALTVDPERCGMTRDDIISALEKENIEARPVWKPMHLQPLFAECRYYPHGEGLSISDRLFETGLCLPSGSNLQKEEQARVIECIWKCLGR